MPFVDANGLRLHYESVGSGPPVVFCHEYASDARAWEAQLRFFGRRYRAIAYNGRGYPPSTVPQDDSDWLHHHLINDLAGLLDALGIERAHVVGQATGGNVALNFAIAHPERVNGLVVIGAGAGTSDRDRWLAGARALADDIAARGTAQAFASIEQAPQRAIFQAKDPRGWQDFLALLHDLSPVAAEKLMRITLTDRLPVTALKEKLAGMTLPVLVMTGDQDFPSHEACRFIRDHAPHAGLAMLPMCGHAMNLEEPMLFNQMVSDFLSAVDAGRWGTWSRAAEAGRSH
jgi:pimeloyl-ACP methyl ester carboxylesterase